MIGIGNSLEAKTARWINSEYEKDDFDQEAFLYALKAQFTEAPSEESQLKTLDILESRYGFSFSPYKRALLISSRMY
jgi:hypothetical protein